MKLRIDWYNIAGLIGSDTVEGDSETVGTLASLKLAEMIRHNYLQPGDKFFVTQER